MNLAKLLVAGKSVINGSEEILYRANKHVYLPKFGLAQNPFKSPDEAELAEPAKPVVETIAAPIKKIVTPVAAKTQKIPPWPPRPVRVTSWASKLNPISMWRGSAPAAPSAPCPVQSELSLDSVKVVHNDLSDADVEVVPIKSRTADEVAVPVLPPPEKSWEFLAERMFHTTVD
ncbi:MAG: hypothetical protein ABSH11_12040 [Verrucomicrobiota bacterium]|jgi:hypothetical protein